MISTIVLIVAIIGTTTLRYRAILDTRRAAALTTATRIGLMLTENWRALKGNGTYNPTEYLDSEMAITNSDGPDAPEDFTLLGSYKIQLNNCNYYTTLSWKDVQTGLRALNINVVWAQQRQSSASLEDTDKTFKFTTYTTN